MPNDRRAGRKACRKGREQVALQSKGSAARSKRCFRPLAQACRDQQSALFVDSCKRTLAAEVLSAAWLSLRKCLTFHLSILGMPGNGCSFPRQ